MDQVTWQIVCTTTDIPIELGLSHLTKPRWKIIEWSKLILSIWATEEHGSAPQHLLMRRWPTIKAHFLHTWGDGFIIVASYMNIYPCMCCSMTSVKYWGSSKGMQSSRRKNLPIVSSGHGIWRTFLWNMGVWERYHYLFIQCFGPKAH